MIKYARAAAVIDLTCIAANIGIVKKMVSTNTMVMAVVKANGYGHGIYEVSTAALSAGADWLGVATVTEGVFLRRFGINVPILVLSPVFEEEYENLILNDLNATIFSLETAKGLSSVASYLMRPVKLHIKIDTGMNRIGYGSRLNEVSQTAKEILKISALPNLVITGLYSHLATSDSGAEFAKEQFSRFLHIINEIESLGLHIPIKHISNSGGIINHREFDLSMVRAGVLTYGLAPNSKQEGAKELALLGIKPALTLKSRVAQVKSIYCGESVGYSRKFFASSNMQVATVPIGYGDGLSRALSNRGAVLINGCKCDIIGNVCMDQFMVNATGANAKLRDEVIIIGMSGDERIWAEDVACAQSSINYEVVTALSERMPRFYINHS